MIRLTVIALAASLAVIWAVLWLRPGLLSEAIRSAAGIGAPSGVQVGGDFSLVNQDGKPVTAASYRGRWMLVYFGYTFCPDVCPTELQTISSALDSLGSQADQVVPVFITVDPERDTPAHLGEYVKLFSDRLVGLTGTPQQIAAAARAYRVYYQKVVPKNSTTYLMDHSSFLYLMGPDGTFRALFRPGTTVQDLAEAIRSRLSASS